MVPFRVAGRSRLWEFRWITQCMQIFRIWIPAIRHFGMRNSWEKKGGIRENTNRASNKKTHTGILDSLLIDEPLYWPDILISDLKLAVVWYFHAILISTILNKWQESKSPGHPYVFLSLQLNDVSALLCISVHKGAALQQWWMLSAIFMITNVDFTIIIGCEGERITCFSISRQCGEGNVWIRCWLTCTWSGCKWNETGRNRGQ